MGLEVYLEYDINGIFYGEYRIVVERCNGFVGVDYFIVLGKVFFVFWLRGIDVYVRVSLCVIFWYDVCFFRRCFKNMFMYFLIRLSWLFIYILDII